MDGFVTVLSLTPEAYKVDCDDVDCDDVDCGVRRLGLLKPTRPETGELLETRSVDAVPRVDVLDPPRWMTGR